MKIKAVCEATGLTDRTVRYYIEEGIFSPFYTENYLGRKTFDFSESDIRTLNDIATLRKFGFSIAEIKEMFLHPEEIIRITKELENRKKTLINEEKDLLLTLSKLDSKRSYTVTELAAFLSNPVIDHPLPPEDTKWNLRQVITNFLKSLFLSLVIWLPIILSVLSAIVALGAYSYPKIQPLCIILALISLMPTFLIIALPKLKKRFHWNPIMKRVLLVFCVLNIPVSSFMSLGITFSSETTDFRYYRDFDPECLANRSDLFQALFPKWPHYFDSVEQSNGHFETVYLDAHYYYHFFQGFDYTYDIYAEWPLKQGEFDKEVARVKQLFEEYANVEEMPSYWNYTVIRKGSYQCLFIYEGDEPFKQVTSSYTYCIFAYDEKNLRVRYIYCDSLENGEDQPYYLSLNWE